MIFVTIRYHSAERAQDEYRYSLVDSGEGINLTSSELVDIASIIVTPIKNGQSVYAIPQHHPQNPQIHYSEKTIYNQIKIGAFESFGLNNMTFISKLVEK